MTGQVRAVFSRIALCFSSSSSPCGKRRCMSIPPIRRGPATMCLVTSTVRPRRSTPRSFAFMPIVVAIQAPSPVAMRSVGEKRSPRPLLSVGASVSMALPLWRCLALVWRSPKAWSASFRERYASLPSWFRGMLFVVLGGLAVFVGRLDGPDRLLMPLSDITAGAFFALCIFALAVGGDGLFRRVVGCKPLVWVGTFSYSLYLIHAPLLQVATQYGLDTWASSLDLRVGLLVFVGTPVIVGLAWLFFLVCEKPFIKMNQRVRKPVALEVVTDPAP